MKEEQSRWSGRTGGMAALVLATILNGTMSGAPTLALLHSFSDSSGDGYGPQAGLVFDTAGNLYGTTPYGGGTDNYGTIFRIGSDGTGYTILHSFTGSEGDGNSPNAGLVLDGQGNLYGTTVGGGDSDAGVVFRIRTDGTGFTVLYTFSGSSGDGSSPEAGLILDSSGYLYGTTNEGGGDDDVGTVFKVRTNGTGFEILHEFSDSPNDGSQPLAGLVLDGAGNLYGTTMAGGANSIGSIFRVRTDGTAFTLLHSFAPTEDDGQSPYGGLVLDGNGNLHGTTYFGGSEDAGAVFRIRTDGTGFSLVYSFLGSDIDGELPQAGLLLDGSGNLYGTVSSGGADDDGGVFTVRTNGTDFQLLHTFAGAPNDGSSSVANLVFDGSGNVYGTTSAGGTNDSGAVFKLILATSAHRIVIPLPGPAHLAVVGGRIPRLG